MNANLPKVLLISTLHDSGKLTEPVALEYLAGYLIEHEYQVNILCSLPIKESIQNILSQICETHPAVIGFTIWDINSDFVLLISKKIKEIYPNIIIIVGGYHARYLSSSQVDSIDYFVIGEGENAILRILNNINDKTNIKNKVIKSEPINNLDILPLPARQLVNYEAFPFLNELKYPKNITQKYTYIFTYRGCPMSCSFCAIHEVHEKKIRKRTISNIMTELHELYEKYQINTFINEEDMLFTDKNRVIEWCNAIKNSPYEFVWTCSGTVRYMDEEILLSLKSAGCKYVFLGSISGSDTILKKAKTGFRTEHLQIALETATKVGMPISSSFMIGFPGETNETLNETYCFIKKNRSLYWDLGVGLLKPYVGTHVSSLTYTGPDDSRLKEFIIKLKNDNLIDFSF